MTFEEKIKKLGFYTLYDFGHIKEYRNEKYGLYESDVKLILDFRDKTITFEFTHEHWIPNEAPEIDMSLLEQCKDLGWIE